MRYLWPIALFVVVASFGSLLVGDLGIGVVFVAAIMGFALDHVFSSRYKSMSSSHEFQRVHEDAKVFHGFRISKGGFLVRNRSGMGLSFDAANPIAFLGISEKGIYGAFTLLWHQITAVELIDANTVKIEIKKSFRFLNVTEIEIIFYDEDQPKQFYEEAKKRTVFKVNEKHKEANIVQK